MRTLAIDLGLKRVGLAISDDAGRYATPHEVVDASTAEQVVVRLLSSEQIRRVVIGLPLNMDDSLGPAARRVVAWGRALAEKTGIKPDFVDERLSSFGAQEQLRTRKQAGEKLTRARKREQLDAIAAALFLQEYLDGKLPPLAVGE